MSATGPEPAELVVTVDRARCAGTGLCAASAPADLQVGPDGKAHPRHERSTALAAVVEAAELCPMEAIAVHHATTGELLAPQW
ncbi:ferredoxin [Streptomyces tateyamensis]|uniref:ferredoxin n=1 Tax=Streptomyces tateyamensis TaxID=565073 RepID=UPI001FE867FD|nr:ferredoxin [Streptomyces tateyamensis]